MHILLVMITLWDICTIFGWMYIQTIARVCVCVCVKLSCIMPVITSCTMPGIVPFVVSWCTAISHGVKIWHITTYMLIRNMSKPDSESLWIGFWPSLQKTVTSFWIITQTFIIFKLKQQGRQTLKEHLPLSLQNTVGYSRMKCEV